MAKSLPVIGLLFVAALALAAPTPTKTIVDVAAAIPDLSTLVTALKAADLVQTLATGLSLTVLAPTNEAFAKLPKATLAHLLEPANVKELVDLLSYHVLPETTTAEQIIQFTKKYGGEIRTIEGQNVKSSVYQNHLFINDASVTTADIEASNGFIHIIDTVLTVPAPASTRTIVQLISRDPALSTLVTALTAADLIDTLSGAGSFTVFAPTNKAFSLIPSAVLAHLLAPANIKELQTLLEYHVLPRAIQSKELLRKRVSLQKTIQGRPLVLKNSLSSAPTGALLVNDALATFVDLQASNGVVHVIDQVLLPTFTSDRDLIEVIASQPQLSTFATVLKAADFTRGVTADGLGGNGRLQRFQPVWDKFVNQCAYGQRGPSIFHVPSKGAQCPFTVFAPTNEAFAKLPKATLERLLNPANQGELQDILELHIVPGVALEAQRLRVAPYPAGFTDFSLPGFVSTLHGNTDLNSCSDGDPQFFLDGIHANGTTLLSADIFYEYPDHIPKQTSGIVLGNLANLGASNGIVHLIDSVLIPLVPTKTIAEDLAAYGPDEFTTFVAALKAGLLERTLNDTASGPYTVFVPTDGAFSKLPSGTLKHLLAPENIGELQDLLEYHIIPGVALRTGCVNAGRTCHPARDLEGPAPATLRRTLMGKDVEITLVGEAGVDGSVMIDKSNIPGFRNSAFDGSGNGNNRASNGNWIKIDQVLTKYYMPTLV